MYNKLFTKILDSSVWLTSDATRLVWLTFIASMDEDGFCPFAAVGNLAHRARVSLDACHDALRVLEGTDAESSNPAHDGRRIERVPGGWVVLNAQEHRDMVTRTIARERTRARVARHRERKRACNGAVTQSEAYTEARSEKIKPVRRASRVEPGEPQSFLDFWSLYPNRKGKQAAMKAWAKLNPDADLIGLMASALVWQKAQPQWTKDGGQFVPMLSTWLNQRRWEDELPTTPGRKLTPNDHGYYDR